MSKAARTSIDSDEWSTIRDHEESGDGYVLPKYEAKFVEDLSKEALDDEIVLVRETSSSGGERLYHVPRAVIEDVSGRLP